jgi:vacuolar-type H+-ATPase subunit I/STV1
MSFLSKLMGLFSKETQKEEKIIKIETKAKEPETVKVETNKEEVALSEIDALKQELSSAFDKLSSMDEYWDAIVAIEAVATSMASSDKDFSEAERQEIKQFIQKLNPNKEMPSSVKERIDAIYATPLPLNQAFLLAKETKIDMSVYEDIIETVMHTDGVKFEEKVVLNAWHNFKMSA